MVSLTPTQQRLYDKLVRDLGDEMVSYLEDSNIHEIMCNPDGSVWIDEAQTGLKAVGLMPSMKATSIINSVAGLHGFVVNLQQPRLEAEFPFYHPLRGERFTAQVPPIVSASSFTIRKKSNPIFSLDDYFQSKKMTLTQKEILSEAVISRKNILVCGSPGSGKTTLTNALIREAVLVEPNQRFVLLEDLPELQCNAQNKVAMVTSMHVTMTDLLRASMRMRPDRILVGEVRGGEALDMLKAWNTGCPGGICTVHANGAVEALQRICDLAMEAGLVSPPKGLVAQTIDLIVHVSRASHQKGMVTEIILLEGVNDGVFQYQTL